MAALEAANTSLEQNRSMGGLSSVSVGGAANESGLAAEMAQMRSRQNEMEAMLTQLRTGSSHSPATAPAAAAAPASLADEMAGLVSPLRNPPLLVMSGSILKLRVATEVARVDSLSRLLHYLY